MSSRPGEPLDFISRGSTCRRTMRCQLRSLRRAELTRPADVVTAQQPPSSPSSPSPAATYSASSHSFRFQIPAEVTVNVGVAVLQPCPTPAALPPVSKQSSASEALAAARVTLKDDPNVVDVRLGYRFKNGWITDERVVVVEVREKLSRLELRTRGIALVPPAFGELGVDVRTAAARDQLAHMGVDLSTYKGRSGPGAYRDPPDLRLDRVIDKMKATFHVSPDSGFPNLKAFFGRVKAHLTATMYEWDAAHITEAIVDAMDKRPGNTLRMVTQKKTSAGGTEAAVQEVQHRIGAKFSHAWASVGAGLLFPSAYHIKVASRDGEEFWLSSGNWKDSNQPDIDPAGTGERSISDLRKFNRDWHVIIAHAGLASLFQKYIEFDFREAERVPLEEAVEPTQRDVFIPEVAFLEALERPEVQYKAPLVIDRQLDVQPLLTPDHGPNGGRLFIAHATEMVEGATSRVYVENQSFSYLANDGNEPEFERFFVALLKKQQAGVDVRVTFRDPREFSRGADVGLQKLLELLKDFGLDTAKVKVQRKCHTKGIVVDGAEVLIGSENLTNAGALFNRDASLRVRDPEVAKYFEEIFLYDWDVLATQTADESVDGMRLAGKGEPTPANFRRVSVAALLGHD